MNKDVYNEMCISAYVFVSYFKFLKSDNI